MAVIKSTSDGSIERYYALATICALVAVVGVVGTIIHHLYFHPLHHIPGPRIRAISRLPYVRDLLTGKTGHSINQLHQKYGDVVRISPNEVSFSSGETAWQDIAGFRVGKHKGQLNMMKDPLWYAQPPQGSHIVFSNDEDHTRFRKVLSHSFSERSLMEQEPLLQKYVNLFISQLRKVTSETGSSQNMARWFNWTTFDVIADLLFGESFGNLENLHSHGHMELILESTRNFKMAYLKGHYPLAVRLRNFLSQKDMMQRRIDFYNWVQTQTRKRVEKDTDRADFMTEILKHNGEKGAAMSDLELSNNAGVFLAAGTETTASLLNGATYLVLKHPTMLQKLREEIRSKWGKYEDITLESVNNAPYLIAVLSEALRYFPPAPAGFARIVGPGGAVVSGVFIPESTSVSVTSFAVGHSERNFKDADEFHPERWLGDARYADDKRNAMQPFSFGPRNCIGKNLALAEMRLIFAKLIWSFDLELDPASKNWMDECRIETVWQRPPLLVHVKEAVHY